MKYATRIQNILLPFYFLHQSEIDTGIFFSKDDDLSVFLSNPENYDYDTYKKRQFMKRFLAKLISRLRNIL